MSGLNRVELGVSRRAALAFLVVIFGGFVCMILAAFPWQGTTR